MQPQGSAGVIAPVGSYYPNDTWNFIYHRAQSKLAAMPAQSSCRSLEDMVCFCSCLRMCFAAFPVPVPFLYPSAYTRPSHLQEATWLIQELGCSLSPSIRGYKCFDIFLAEKGPVENRDCFAHPCSCCFRSTSLFRVLQILRHSDSFEPSIQGLAVVHKFQLLEMT